MFYGLFGWLVKWTGLDMQYVPWAPSNAQIRCRLTLRRNSLFHQTLIVKKSETWFDPVTSFTENHFCCETNGALGGSSWWSAWLKHSELAAEAVQHGWKTQVPPVEVGCRGFVATLTFLSGCWKEWVSEDRVIDKPIEQCQKLLKRGAAGCGWNKMTGTSLQEDDQWGGGEAEEGVH